MNLSSFDRFVWAAGFLGCMILLFVLWKRGRVRSFPVFTALIASNAIRTILLFFIRRDLPRAYAGAFWSMSLLDEALQWAIVYEISLSVFRPTGVWAKDTWRTFLGAAGLSIMVAAGLTWLDAPATTDRVQAYVFRANFFSAALMSELFVAMVALSAAAGLAWKTHVARIAQGLGVYSMVCVGRDVVSSAVGLRHAVPIFIAMSHLRIATYVACEAYWIVMLWQEAPAPRELPDGMRMQIYVLQRQVEDDLERIRSWGRRS